MDTLIIADTLTGAADSGVKFSINGPVRLTSFSDQQISGFNGIVAFNTETRNKPPEQIVQVLMKISSLLGRWQPKLIFKKIDSCLKGQVGLEVATVLRMFNFSCALVAPAYPERGRVTLRGIHLVDGKPLHRTLPSDAPAHLLKDSRLKAVLAHDHDLPIESLEIGTIREGPEAIGAAIRSFMGKHKRFLLVCDSEFDDDLIALTEGSKPYASKILYSGSISMATALLEVFDDRHNWLQDAFHPPSPSGPIIFFGGSASEVLKNQFKVLAEEHKGEIITLKLKALFEGPGQTIPALSHGRPLIVTLPPLSLNPEDQKKYPDSEVVVRFGQLAADLIRNRQYLSVFLSGGETAKETIKALGYKDIFIRSELLPGIVYLSAGPLSIIAKSGDKGEPDLLSKLYRNMRQESPLGLV